jgi:hypothetical protein
MRIKIGTVCGGCTSGEGGGRMKETKVREYGGWTSYSYTK